MGISTGESLRSIKIRRYRWGLFPRANKRVICWPDPGGQMVQSKTKWRLSSKLEILTEKQPGKKKCKVTASNNNLVSLSLYRTPICSGYHLFSPCLPKSQLSYLNAQFSFSSGDPLDVT